MAWVAGLGSASAAKAAFRGCRSPSVLAVLYLATGLETVWKIDVSDNMQNTTSVEILKTKHIPECS